MPELPNSDDRRPESDLSQGSETPHESLNGEQAPEDDFHAAAIDREDPERSLLLARSAALTAAEQGGRNILVLDMTQRAALFDYFVIATGTSRRQLHAMSEEIDHKLEDELNDKRMNIDGYDDSRWIVLDYGTVVVHLFDEDTRSFYALEALWSDAPRLDLNAELAAIDPQAAFSSDWR